MREFWLDVLGSLMAAVISPVVVVLFASNYLMILTRPFGRRIPGIKKAYDWWDKNISVHAKIQIGLDY